MHTTHAQPATRTQVAKVMIVLMGVLNLGALAMSVHDTVVSFTSY